MFGLSKFDLVLVAGAILVAGLAARRLVEIRHTHRSSIVKSAQQEEVSTAKQSAIKTVATLSPVQPVATAVAATPTARPQASAHCVPPKEQFYVLSKEQTVELHTGGATMKLTANQVGNLCLKPGTALALVGIAKTPVEPYAYRGFAVVDTFEPSGDVNLTVMSRVLDPPRKFAPLCLDACDGIVNGIAPPQDPNERRFLVVDARKEDEHQLRWSESPSLHIWHSVAPAEVDQWLRGMALKMKGATIFAMTLYPAKKNDQFLALMKQIKSASPNKLYWYYEGELGLFGHALEPALPPGAQLTRAATMAPLLKLGASLVMVSGRKQENLTLIPNSLVVTTSLDESDKATRKSRGNALYKWSLGESYDLAKFPKDPNKTYIIYGKYREDWRPWYFMQFLLSLGYKNLYWIQGGLAEYRVAKDLNLIH